MAAYPAWKSSHFHTVPQRMPFPLISIRGTLNCDPAARQAGPEDFQPFTFVVLWLATTSAAAIQRKQKKRAPLRLG